MRMAFRMADREILHVISSSNHSRIVAEVLETRLMRKRKYFLPFDNFKGELHYSPNHPERSRLTLDVDATSVSCRDRSLREVKQGRVTEQVQDSVLNARAHPMIQFSSYQITVKPLRGLLIEGALSIRGTTRALKLNAVFTPTSEDGLEIEGDSILRLSEFGIKAPSLLFGMVETSDQVLVHLHLYAVRAPAASVVSATASF